MRISQKIPVRKTTILAIISILLILIIFKTSINLEDFSRAISNLNWFYFYIAFATVIPITIINGVKWYLVVRASGYNVSFKKIFSIVITSISLGVLPGRLGDFARSYPLRNTIPVSQSIGTILLEKVLDISILLAFSGLGLFVLGYYKIALLILILAIFSIPLLRTGGSILKKILPENNLTQKLNDVLSVLSKIKNGKSFFFLATLGSFANSILSMLQIYWLFKALGAAVPLFTVFAFQPLSMFAGLLPITLAGVGTRDSAIIYLFRGFATPEQSLAVGILYSIQSYWFMALIALPLLYYFFKEE